MSKTDVGTTFKLTLPVVESQKESIKEIALEMIKETHFDIILSDIILPVMGGFDLLDQFLASDATKNKVHVHHRWRSQRI